MLSNLNNILVHVNSHIEGSHRVIFLPLLSLSVGFAFDFFEFFEGVGASIPINFLRNGQYLALPPAAALLLFHRRPGTLVFIF